MRGGPGALNDAYPLTNESKKRARSQAQRNVAVQAALESALYKTLLSVFHEAIIRGPERARCLDFEPQSAEHKMALIKVGSTYMLMSLSPLEYKDLVLYQYFLTLPTDKQLLHH